MKVLKKNRRRPLASPTLVLDLPWFSHTLHSRDLPPTDSVTPLRVQAGGRPPPRPSPSQGADAYGGRRHRLDKRSSYRSVDQIFNSNSNFEILSTWNVSEMEDVATATEMSDDMLRSLGFPVPATTASPSIGGRREKQPILPIVDNHFIHFVSRK